MKRTLIFMAAGVALSAGCSTTSHADDDLGFRHLPSIFGMETDSRQDKRFYRINDDDDDDADGWRTRGAIRGQGWHDDDDDGRRGYRGRWQHDDDDDHDGRRGGWDDDDD